MIGGLWPSHGTATQVSLSQPLTTSVEKSYKILCIIAYRALCPYGYSLDSFRPALDIGF